MREWVAQKDRFTGKETLYMTASSQGDCNVSNPPNSQDEWHPGLVLTNNVYCYVKLQKNSHYFIPIKRHRRINPSTKNTQCRPRKKSPETGTNHALRGYISPTVKLSSFPFSKEDPPISSTDTNYENEMRKILIQECRICERHFGNPNPIASPVAENR